MARSAPPRRMHPPSSKSISLKHSNVAATGVIAMHSCTKLLLLAQRPLATWCLWLSRRAQPTVLLVRTEWNEHPLPTTTRAPSHTLFGLYAGLVTQFYLAVLSRRALTMVTYDDLPPFESACNFPYFNFTHPHFLPDQVLDPIKTSIVGDPPTNCEFQSICPACDKHKGHACSHLGCMQGHILSQQVDLSTPAHTTFFTSQTSRWTPPCSF